MMIKNRAVAWTLRIVATAALLTTSSYSFAVTVRHDFDLQLNNNQPYRFIWDFQVKASASSRTEPFDTASDAGNVGRPAGAAPPGASSRSVDARSNGATADATSRFSATAAGTGFHEVEANANRGAGTGASAFANSQFSYITGTRDGQGRIRWNPRWTVEQLDTKRGLRTGRLGDPIFFAVTDLDTGAAVESELFAIALELLGPGAASWENGLASVEGTDGFFSIRMDSEFITSPTGILLAEFEDGLITFAEDSGVFDGLLPAVGSPAVFDLAFGDPEGFINIDFDFGPENINGYDVRAEFGGSAEVFEAPEPRVIGVLLLGLLMLGFRHRSLACHRAHQR